MDKTEIALKSFRNPHNCAQTVYAAFGDGDESKLAELKNFGGGRAPENMCGALYSALQLMPDGKRATASAEFAARVGSLKCREIKGVHKTPCEVCVKTACEILGGNASK